MKKKNLSKFLALTFFLQFCTMLIQPVNANSIDIEDIQSSVSIEQVDEQLDGQLNKQVNEQSELMLKESFSDEELNRLNQERQEQDKIEFENGFTRVKTEVVSSSIKSNNYNYGLRAANKNYIGDSIYYVDVIDTYTGSEEILNDSSKGMAFFLDVSWNYFVSKQAGDFWKAASILGVAPSDFLSKYKRGDKLSSTKTKVIARRCYKKYNKIMKGDMWYLETRRVTIKNYVDLYTFDRRNKSVRRSSTGTKTFYSQNYYNTSWIKSYVNRACSLNLQGPKIDTII